MDLVWNLALQPSPIKMLDYFDKAFGKRLLCEPGSSKKKGARHERKVQLQRCCANYIGQTCRMSRWFSATQKAVNNQHQQAFKSKLGEKHAILGKKTKHYWNSTLFNVKP